MRRREHRFRALEGPVGGADDALLSEQSARATALSYAISRRTAWDRTLREVAVVMPSDAWLTTFAGLSSTDAGVAGPAPADAVSTLTLTGFSLSREGVAKLITRLETLPGVSSVQLLAATTTELVNEEVVEFSITATLKPSGGATP